MNESNSSASHPPDRDSSAPEESFLSPDVKAAIERDRNEKSVAGELFARFVRDGQGTVRQLIDGEISEELYVEYKKSVDHGAGEKLHHDDRAHLAKAISGFGNSDGGLLIWGINCVQDPQRGDLPDKVVAIHNPRRFAEWLKANTSGCTIPPHRTAVHLPIEWDEPGKGIVVTYIPESQSAPHQCIIESQQKKGGQKGRYFIRVGSSFENAPHSVLAGMFGRRPNPNLTHMWEISAFTSKPWPSHPLSMYEQVTVVRCAFLVANIGRSLARDVYINYHVSLPSIGQFQKYLQEPWREYDSLIWTHAISPAAYRFPPGASNKVFGMSLSFPPEDADLPLSVLDSPVLYSITYGCEGAAPKSVDATIDIDALRLAFDVFKKSNQDDDARRKFVRSAFGLPRD